MSRRRHQLDDDDTYFRVEKEQRKVQCSIANACFPAALSNFREKSEEAASSSSSFDEEGEDGETEVPMERPFEDTKR